MSIRSITLSALLLTAGLASPAFAADAPWTYTAAVRVAVDPSGHARVLSFGHDVPKGLIPTTTAAIERWEFEPAQRDGVAVASETNLFVRYDVRESDKGYTFDIAHVDIGAGIKRSELPAYPSAAISARQTGEVLLKVDIDEQGRPIHIVDISGKKLRYLSEAAIASVRRWRFDPQKVDGVAIVEPVVVPIEFKLVEVNERPTILQPNTQDIAAPPLPPSEQVTRSDQPVVKMLTKL